MVWQVQLIDENEGMTVFDYVFFSFETALETYLHSVKHYGLIDDQAHQAPQPEDVHEAVSDRHTLQLRARTVHTAAVDVKTYAKPKR